MVISKGSCGCFNTVDTVICVAHRIITSLRDATAQMQWVFFAEEQLILLFLCMCKNGIAILPKTQFFTHIAILISS